MMDGSWVKVNRVFREELYQLHPLVISISEPDLTNITRQSVVIATEIDIGVTEQQYSVTPVPNGGGIFGPQCHTWDLFTNGVHVYCWGGGYGSPNPSTTELRIAVLNP
jgi:hypothetical protein